MNYEQSQLYKEIVERVKEDFDIVSSREFWIAIALLIGAILAAGCYKKEDLGYEISYWNPKHCVNYIEKDLEKCWINSKGKIVEIKQ